MTSKSGAGFVPPSNESVAPIEPAMKEHGVWGTTSQAVGGFGESYDDQVAHGSENELPVPDAEPAPDGGAASGLDDERLERELRKTLERAHSDASELQIAVHHRRVILHGSVAEALEKLQIESRARAVPGVLSVTSHLKVKNP